MWEPGLNSTGKLGWVNCTLLNRDIYSEIFNREVVRAVQLNCPAISFVPEERQVCIAELPFLKGYVLACVKNLAGNQEAYGVLLTKPGADGRLRASDQFHAFDGSEELPSLIAFIEDIDSSDVRLSNLQSINASFVSYSSQSDRAVYMPSKRHRVHMPTLEWNAVTSEEHKSLAKSAGLDGSRVHVWRAAIPFLRQTDLVEFIEEMNVLIDDDARYRRGYALVLNRDGRAENFIPIKPDTDVYSIAASADHGLKVTEENVGDYLRLFFFIRGGRYGRFLLIGERNGLPFNAAPSQEHRATIRDFLKPPELVDKEAVSPAARERFGDDVEYARFACFFKQSLFQCMCAINRETKFVSLFDETLHAEDLPIVEEDVDSSWIDPSRVDAKKELSDEAVETTKKPIAANPSHSWMDRRPFHYRLSSLHSTGPAIESGGSDDASPGPADLEGGAFLARFWSTGHVMQARLKEVVVLSKDSREERGSTKQGHIVSDCIFEEVLHIRDIHEGGDIEFIGCRFKKGVECSGSGNGRSIRFYDCEFWSDSVEYLHNRHERSAALNFRNSHIGGDLEFWRSRFIGQVSGSGATITGDLLFRGCQLASRSIGRPLYRQVLINEELKSLKNGSLALGAATVPWQEFDELILDLDDAVIEGKFEFGGAGTVRSAIDEPRKAWQRATDEGSESVGLVSGRTSFINASVGGDISVFGSLICGTVDISRARVTGDVQFGMQGLSALRILHGSLLMNGIHVKGGFVFTGVDVRHFYSPPTQWHVSIDLQNAVVDEDVDLTFTDVMGGVFMRNMSLRGSMNLFGLYCGGHVDLDFANISNAIYAYRNSDYLMDREALHVRGDMTLTGANVKMIRMQAVLIEGIVRAHTSEFAAVRFDTGQGRNGELLPCRLGALWLRSSSVASDLRLVGVQLNEPVDQYEKMRMRQQAGDCALAITACTIGGDVLLFDEDLNQRLSSWAWNEEDGRRWQEDESAAGMHPARSWGRVDFQASRITGVLDLRNLRAEGSLELVDAAVGRDLDLGHGYQPLKLFTGQRDGMRPVRSSCSRFKAEKLICGGDMRLTGLSVASDFEATGARVAGSIEFASAAGFGSGANDQHHGPQVAHLHGKVDLTAVSADELRMTKWNFNEDKCLEAIENETTPAQLILERSVFSKLAIGAPTPPINLSKIKVDRWVFGEDVTHDASKYIEILERMTPMDHGVWIDVENGLRNLEAGDEADRVYRRMKWNHWRLSLSIGRLKRVVKHATRGSRRRSWISRPIAYLLNLMLFPTALLYFVVAGYGTAIGRAAVIWAMSLCWGVYVFADPGNVEMAFSRGRLVHVENGRITADDPYMMMGSMSDSTYTGSLMRGIGLEQMANVSDWSRWDAFVLATRYSVPLMDMAFHDQWQASDEAEGKALLLTVNGYLLLSFVALGLTGRAIRGKAN